MAINGGDKEKSVIEKAEKRASSRCFPLTQKIDSKKFKVGTLRCTQCAAPGVTSATSAGHRKFRPERGEENLWRQVVGQTVTQWPKRHL